MKVVSIDLKTLAQIYLRSVCNFPVINDNAVVWCEKCDKASMQSQCKSKTDVKMVVLNESDQLRSNIKLSHPSIEIIFSLTVSKTPKKAITMKLTNKTLSFTLNKVNKCLDMSH